MKKEPLLLTTLLAACPEPGGPSRPSSLDLAKVAHEIRYVQLGLTEGNGGLVRVEHCDLGPVSIESNAGLILRCREELHVPNR
jgi:hypothetical protein